MTEGKLLKITEIICLQTVMFEISFGGNRLELNVFVFSLISFNSKVDIEIIVDFLLKSLLIFH